MALVMAALAGTSLVGAEPAWPQPAVTSGPAGAATAGAMERHSAPPIVPPRSSARRPFDHRWHERISCGACHGTGSQHRTMLVRTPTDCARCHHDQRLGKACADCHAPDQLPTRIRVTVAMALTVRDSAPPRSLPFGHELHKGVACRDCHGTPVTLDRNRTCASCHDRHHRAEANCSSCHDGAVRAAHGAQAHLSCQAAGCHAPRVAPSPALSRSLCLVCHAEQRAHEPGGACATCHKIPGSAAARGAVSAARDPGAAP